MNFGVPLLPKIQMATRNTLIPGPMCNAPRATTAALAKWASCPTAAKGIEDNEDEEHDLGTIRLAQVDQSPDEAPEFTRNQYSWSIQSMIQNEEPVVPQPQSLRRATSL